MENTTQWSIIWSPALLPPLDMLPPNTIFCNVSDNPATNSVYLFGFSLCFSTLPEADEAPMSLLQDETDREDNFWNENADFPPLFALEGLTSFM